MTVTELFMELNRAGATVYLDDRENLRVRGTIPDHLRPIISCRANKGHIIGYLKAAQETVSLGKLVDSLPEGNRKTELFQQWEQLYERTVFLEGLDLYLPKEEDQELEHVPVQLPIPFPMPVEAVDGELPVVLER